MALLGSVSGGLLSLGLRERTVSAAMRDRCSHKLRSSGCRAESLAACNNRAAELWAVPSPCNLTWLIVRVYNRASEGVLHGLSYRSCPDFDAYAKLRSLAFGTGFVSSIWHKT